MGTPPVVEITDEKLANAADRIKKLIDQGHPDADALRIGLWAMITYRKVLGWLMRRGIGIKMLRHMLGIDPPPEDTPPSGSGSGKDKGDKNNQDKKGRHNHGKRGAGQFPQAHHRFFAHPTLDEPGTICPGCRGGGLYPHYGQWHRFEGQPFLRVVIVNYEIWRCTLCQESYPATIATDLIDDGKERQTFGYSAIALIVISKYFLGTPWARQERLQNWLELPLPASTASDQTRTFTDALSPIYDYLQRYAGNAWLFYSDDTGIRILKLKSMVKTQRKTQKETLRTGVHTSVILAQANGGRRVALFKSGILHAGEFLDEILRHRDDGLPAPLHMADGSSCNPATVTPAPILCACNAHGRRKLDEKKDLYPEHWEVVRTTYREVYKHDAETKRLNMTPEQRLAYHKEHSKPLMEAMLNWMQKELHDKNVEPNSQLGGIFEYFLARRSALMAFTEYAGAPIDNNAVEQLIKIVALLRKNAMSFMTLAGAQDADKSMTVGATAGMAGVNLYDYFVCLQRHAELVKNNPEDFLPWTYQQTVRRIEEAALRAPPPQVRELTADQWKARQEHIKNRRTELRAARLSRSNPQKPAALSA